MAQLGIGNATKHVVTIRTEPLHAAGTCYVSDCLDSGTKNAWH